MPIGIDDTYTCDYAGCTGDGTFTPAQSQSLTTNIPSGWIQIHSSYTIGTSVISSTKYFHSRTCLSGQFTNVTLPALAAMGAAA
jgi:hypothetical protein